MIVVAYQRTQAGAMRRMAERGRTFSLPMPAPKPAPQPVPAPPCSNVVTYLASHAHAEAVRRREALRAQPWKPEKPPYIAVEPVPLSSPRKIIALVVAWHPGVTVEDVMSARRTRVIIAARHDAIVAVYLNCRIDGRHYSLPEIGRAFGLDHTSVLFCLRKRGCK